MTQEPLAYRMRPTNIDEVAGQKHVIGPNTSLYKMIKMGKKIPSMLLYGEPGIGKTSIASAIAGSTDRTFFAINATTSGKKDIENIIKEAKETDNAIIFIDEIHRFNKLQQDALLDAVEKGTLTLIGATTANPYHDVNPAIRSRCGAIKQLTRLTDQDILDILNRAITDKEKGLGAFDIQIDDEVLLFIAQSTNGEVRSALNILELAVYAGLEEDEQTSNVTKEIVEEFTGKKGLNHDKDGDHHYNTLSAFQKAIRGSDVDGALHFLARLLEVGDEKSIIRRLKVIAFEDIGNSNPEAVMYTCMACDAVRELGFPEARIPLANAVVYLCLSPKSNSAYKALDKAIADVQMGHAGEIPMHLRDTHYASAAKLGHVGYLYPHDYPAGWVNQEYLPDTLKGKQYYEPKEMGEEKKLAMTYHKLQQLKNKK